MLAGNPDMVGEVPHEAEEYFNLAACQVESNLITRQIRYLGKCPTSRLGSEDDIVMEPPTDMGDFFPSVADYADYYRRFALVAAEEELERAKEYE